MASESAGTRAEGGVVGLGTMGSGIAQLCVQAGVPTVAVEVDARAGRARQGARRARSSRGASRRGG